MIHDMTAPIKSYLTTAPAEEKIVFFLCKALSEQGETSISWKTTYTPFDGFSKKFYKN